MANSSPGSLTLKGLNEFMGQVRKLRGERDRFIAVITELQRIDEEGA